MAIDQLAGQLRSGATTSVALAERALAAARADRYGAFVEVTWDLARSAAAAADRELSAGTDRGPLHGIPVAVKDVIDVAGVPTRSGTSGYGHRMPGTDAGVWRALREAGAVLIGKTRLPGLALDVHTPGCVNPRDATRECGGSSGGSAAAVAAGVVPVALGTDTSGSVRIPAALTGVAGLRPTSGSLSGDGVSPLSVSQDTVGVLAACSRDCLLAFGILRRGMPGGVPDCPAGTAPRVAVPGALWRGHVAAGVAAAFSSICDTLASAGWDLRDCSLPLAELAPAVSYLLTAAEAAAQWPEPPAAGTPAMPDRVLGHLAVGRALPVPDYQGARSLAAQIRQEVLGVLARDADLLALPTTAATAAPVGAEYVRCGPRQEPVASAYCRFTALASVAGLPAVSVPCGTDADGLPVGLQLIGSPQAEPAVCEAGAVVEMLCGHAGSARIRS